jgi:hypothetical protein
MHRTLYFKHCQYDSVLLNTQDTVYDFFTESDHDDHSVTDMVEDAAVKWLVSNQHFRRMFLEDFFPLPDQVKIFDGLRHPFTISGRLPGDIDLLLVDPARCDAAIGIECKRVKLVSTDTYPNVNGDGVAKIRRGILQANGYRELGFHQSYLMIIVLEDGRAMTTPNTMFRYSKHYIAESIYNIPWHENLHQDVGVIFVKVNQTTGKSIELTGGLGFCVDKKAALINQSHRITTNLKELLSNEG